MAHLETRWGCLRQLVLGGARMGTCAPLARLRRPLLRVPLADTAPTELVWHARGARSTPTLVPAQSRAAQHAQHQLIMRAWGSKTNRLAGPASPPKTANPGHLCVRRVLLLSLRQTRPQLCPGCLSGTLSPSRFQDLQMHPSMFQGMSLASCSLVPLSRRS